MAANIQAYLENLRQPWGQIYYDILFEQLQDLIVLCQVVGYKAKTTAEIKHPLPLDVL